MPYISSFYLNQQAKLLRKLPTHKFTLLTLEPIRILVWYQACHMTYQLKISSMNLQLADQSESTFCQKVTVYKDQ